MHRQMRRKERERERESQKGISASTLPEQCFQTWFSSGRMMVWQDRSVKTGQLQTRHVSGVHDAGSLTPAVDGTVAPRREERVQRVCFARSIDHRPVGLRNIDVGHHPALVTWPLVVGPPPLLQRRSHGGTDTDHKPVCSRSLRTTCNY